MTNRREVFGLVLFVGMLFLATVSATSTEEADAPLYAPLPEPDSDTPLSPQYSPFSPEADTLAPDSSETEPEPESLPPLYPPTISPSAARETGSPPEPRFESIPPETSSESGPPEYPPALSPSAETEPSDSDSDSSIPSMPLPLPSMAPITGDDNDAEPTYEPTSSPSIEFDQGSGNSYEGTSESYTEQDTAMDHSSPPSDRQSKSGSGAVFGVVAGVCLVGLGGFVYMKRKENGKRKSKYDQYLELGKRDQGV